MFPDFPQKVAWLGHGTHNINGFSHIGIASLILVWKTVQSGWTSVYMHRRWLLHLCFLFKIIKNFANSIKPKSCWSYIVSGGSLATPWVMHSWNTLPLPKKQPNDNCTQQKNGKDEADSSVLTFPFDLTAKERRLVHEAAEELGCETC